MRRRISFPHFWEQMFGSGRAIFSLRDSYRHDLNDVHQITGFQYVRFHGILNDDVGIYGEDKHGNPVYNFSYVDQIYDGLLAAHVKPFVELSFMPYKLAGSQMLQSFWYHPNVSPPKDYAIWDDMITQLVKHLVERYGEDEVGELVLRSVERAQPRLLGGRAAAEDLFRALRSHRARYQVC